MDTKFHDDLIAELAAVNMAVHRALHHLASLSGDRRKFLDRELEEGLKAISKTKLWSVPQDRLAVVQENASARYQDIIGSIRP